MLLSSPDDPADRYLESNRKAVVGARSPALEVPLHLVHSVTGILRARPPERDRQSPQRTLRSPRRMGRSRNPVPPRPQTTTARRIRRHRASSRGPKARPATTRRPTPRRAKSHGAIPRRAKSRRARTPEANPRAADAKNPSRTRAICGRAKSHRARTREASSPAADAKNLSRTSAICGRASPANSRKLPQFAPRQFLPTFTPPLRTSPQIPKSSSSPRPVAIANPSEAPTISSFPTNTRFVSGCWIEWGGMSSGAEETWGQGLVEARFVFLG